MSEKPINNRELRRIMDHRACGFELNWKCFSSRTKLAPILKPNNGIGIFEQTLNGVGKVIYLRVEILEHRDQAREVSP